MSKPKTFNIIRYKGAPQKATTLLGFDVYREKQIYLVSMGCMVECPEYDNHFVYLDPSDAKGWKTFCTCGAPAVVVGYDLYKGLESKGVLPKLVCMQYTTTFLENGKRGFHMSSDDTGWI